MVGWTRWNSRRAVLETSSFRRCESLKPGTWTSTRSVPWRWMVGSVVPTSSTRLRMTSIDCATSELIRSVMPATVNLTVILPSGVSAKASSCEPPTPKTPVGCSFCSAVCAAVFCVASVSSMVMPSASVVMMLPMPFSLARIVRASRRSVVSRLVTTDSLLTCSSRYEPPCRSRPSVMP